MRVGPTQKEEETLELTLSFQALRGHMKTRQNAVVYKPEREALSEAEFFDTSILVFWPPEL